MTRLARRVVVPVAALLVALGAVLWDPSAPQAMAYQPPPDPVSFPSSVLSSVNSAPVTGTTARPLTTAEWNTFLQSHPELAPTGAGSSFGGKSAASMGVGGTVLTAITGLMIGTDIGNDMAQVFGLTENESFLCDVAQLVGIGGSSCAFGAAPTYVPNSDFLLRPPGYEGLPRIAVDGNTGWNVVAGGSTWFMHDLSPEPGYGAEGSVAFLVQIDLSGQCQASYSSGWAPVLYANVRFTDGTGAGQYVNASYPGAVSGASSIGYRCQTNSGVATVTVPIPAGKQFDSIAFRNAAGGPQLEDGRYRQVWWYPRSHPQRLEDQDPDPQRWWRTSWQCSDGSLGAEQSQPFTETDPEWPGFPVAQCDPSAVTTHILIEQITEGGPTTKMFEWSAPAELIDWAQAHPGCVGGGCDLILSLIDQVTGKRLNCLTAGTLCDGWLTKTKADPEAGEDEFECTYGGSVVPLLECKVYGDKPGNKTYANPTTGDEPTPDAPGEGEQPGPSDCPPPFSWLSLFNPWWYYKGATCALEWAFVPPETSTHLDSIRTTIEGLPPVEFAVAVGGIFDLDVGPAGCQGPGIRWDLMDRTIYPFDACGPPLDTVAQWSRVISTALIGVFGAMAAFRAVGSGFGWKPSAGGDT